MAERPKGYGMTAELAEKRSAKFDAQLEAQSREWIISVTGVQFEGGTAEKFGDALKDGTTLCKLINSLAPGSVKKINESKMAFKQMENIGNFLTACEAYGCNKLDIFQTVDLYEKQNMPQVINGICALARKAGAPGFAKESDVQRREFTEEQLQEGKKVIGLQMGTNKGASQSGMSFGTTRQIH